MRRPLVLAALALLMTACGDAGESDGARPAATRARTAIVPDPAIADRTRDKAARIAAMDALVAPIEDEQREALLLAMSDQSQQAFVMIPDDGELGYHVMESRYGGPDREADARWTAIDTIRRLGLVEALPDLVSALHDRNPGVRNRAAEALWVLGSDAGVPVLLQALEKKAFENETANAALKRITGQDMGFDTDAGWTAKKAAIDLWRAWFETAPRPELPAPGQEPRLDRRLAFLVDVLGQHQFLFMEQARRNLSTMGDLAVARLEERLFGSPPSGNQQLRAYGVQVLENVATPRATAALRRLVEEDPDPSVRARAVEALGQIGGDGAAPTLLAALRDGDEGVRVAAAAALGRRGGEGAEAALREVFAAAPERSRMRLVAAVSLARLGRPEGGAGAHVLEVLRSGAQHERADAILLLEDWKGERRGLDPQRPGAEQAGAIAAWSAELGEG